MSGKPNVKKEDLVTLLSDLKTYVDEVKPPDPPIDFYKKFDLLCTAVTNIEDRMNKYDEMLTTIVSVVTKCPLEGAKVNPEGNKVRNRSKSPAISNLSQRWEAQPNTLMPASRPPPAQLPARGQLPVGMQPPSYAQQVALPAAPQQRPSVIAAPARPR